MDSRLGTRLLAIALFGLGAMPSQIYAQTTPPPKLAQMSIEDLMSVEVTSASRKGQRREDVAAAIFVITREDIDRSGMSTIPDLLRMVPGVQVAEINSNKWAVTVRGFNGLRANKLLVLVDGRSVYNRLFSGVLWDTQDLMLDDIERIEVIRGPGAALWGANAVNGVINIVTKTASDTQGGLARVDVGSEGEQAAARFGGTIGSGHYRLFAQLTGRGASLSAPNVRANDASHSETAGFRADWGSLFSGFVLEGAAVVGQSRGLWPNLDPQTADREPISNAQSDLNSGHLLARWNRAQDGGASWQVQSYFDAATRREPLVDYTRHVFDIDTQYRSPLGKHQDLIIGAEVRFIHEGLAERVGLSLTPPDSRLFLLTAFAQDEASLFGNRLAITLGSQVQYDSDAGAGLQPTARVLWKVTPRQRLWAAASRALRTPSLQDRGIRAVFPPAPSAFGLPLVVVAVGNPAAETERFRDAELGYRLDVGTVASVDVTAFAGRYDRLQTSEPGAPVVELLPSPHVVVTSTFGNQLRASTRGVEISGHWAPSPQWRVNGSYSAFRITPHPAETSLDPAAALEDGSAPSTQWQASAAFSPSARASFYASLAHVGRLEQLQVAAYTRADVTAEFRFTPRLSLMAIGEDLFDRAHTEFAGANSVVQSTMVSQSVSLRLRWRFR